MENPQTRVDRRSVRTKKAIISALGTLMTQKDISKITIKEIADLADINRKTFYAHYGSVHEILDEFENNIIANLSVAIDTLDFQKGHYDPFKFFEKLTSSSNVNFETYAHLMLPTVRGNLRSKIKTVIKDRAVEIYSGALGLDKATLAYVVEYIAGGTISVYEQWFNSDRVVSMEEVCRIIGEMTTGGINRLIEAKKV